MERSRGLELTTDLVNQVKDQVVGGVNAVNISSFPDNTEWAPPQWYWGAIVGEDAGFKDDRGNPRPFDLSLPNPQPRTTWGSPVRAGTDFRATYWHSDVFNPIFDRLETFIITVVKQEQRNFPLQMCCDVIITTRTHPPLPQIDEQCSQYMLADLAKPSMPTYDYSKSIDEEGRHTSSKSRWIAFYSIEFPHTLSPCCVRPP
jgi:hypothetical protein